MRRAISLIGACMLLMGTAWAQDTTPSEGDNSTTEETVDAVKPDAGPAMKPDAGTEDEAPSPAVVKEDTSPQISVTVELTSGIRMAGTISQSDLLSWAPGSALRFTPQGGAQTELNGEQITSVQAGAPSAPVVEVTVAPVPTKPESNYTSPGGFNYPNPAASRYLYAPSSIPLEKGQGYVSQKLVFTSAAYAISDNFTVLYGAFTFFPPALSVFGAKAGFKVKDGVHVSVGGEAFVFGLAQEVPLAIGFGAVTLGHEDKHLTVASGLVGGEMANGVTIPLMVGGQVRVKDSTAVVTENWILIDASDAAEGAGIDAASSFIGSVALRLVGRRDRYNGSPRGMRTASGHPRTTWDIGIVAIGVRTQPSIYDEVNDDEVISDFYSWDVFAPIPWIDWTWHFGSQGID